MRQKSRKTLLKTGRKKMQQELKKVRDSQRQAE